MKEIKKILDECSEALSLDIKECKLISCNTANRVYLINNIYILKIMKKIDARRENYFFKTYKDNEKYEDVIYYEKGKNYIIYNYVKNFPLKIMNRNIANNCLKEIFEIISNYKTVNIDGYGKVFSLVKRWEIFLENEVNEREQDILDGSKKEKVDKCIKRIKKYNFKKKLIHGDLGDYNILYEQGKIKKIIDPRVIIGDPIYDLIFYLYSNISLAENITINDIIKITKEKYEKVITYIYIILYIRISIEKRHGKKSRINKYETLWKKLGDFENGRIFE